MKTTRVYRSDSPACKGELWLPKEPITADTPKMLLIHGGGWRAMDLHSLDGVAPFFREMGFVVYNIDYRLSTEAPWPACGDDCLAAADDLVRAEAEEIRITAGKPIFVFGASAGGHLAMMTGLRMPREQVRGIISVSGIADPGPDAEVYPDRYKILFGGDPIDPQAFPAAHLRKDSPPILMTHCLNDTVVPRDSAYNFAKYAMQTGADVRTYLYDLERCGEGHAIWIPGIEPHRLYPDIAEAVQSFIREILGQPEPLPMENQATYLGKLRRIPSQEISGTPICIGFECLDRDLYEPELCYDKLQAAGIKHARVQTGWCKCEKTKGVYDFTWLDTIVDNLLRRGIQPWFNVGFGNRLYMPDAFGETAVGHVPLYYGEECLEAWKRCCRALAEHFKDRITHYEIWNETNNDPFWKPRKADPVEYGKLIDLTQEQIRKAQPDAKIGGCVAGYRHDYLFEFVRQRDILRKMDFFSIHSYSVLPEQDFANSVRYLRRLLDANGGSHVRIWQGEGGFAHWVPKNYWQSRVRRESYPAQANWIVRRLIGDVALGLEMTSIFIVMDMMQKDYETARVSINRFEVARQGILNGICYTPKPSYHAMANTATLFQRNPRLHDSMINIGMGRTRPATEDLPHLEEVACVHQCFVRDDGQQLIAYYVPVQVEHTYPVIPDGAMGIHDEPDLPPLKQPVLIDLLTGDVWRLAFHRDQHGISIEGLPIASRPMIIADESILG